MKEAFLHHLWKTQSFTTSNLKSTCGKAFIVIDPGELNSNSGPDFLSARIRIDGIVWVGSVEIHLKSSDWTRHRHNIDPAYENTILHAAFEVDAEVKRMDGSPIAHLELKPIIDPKQYAKYMRLKATGEQIPCASQIKNYQEFIQSTDFTIFGHERLSRKAEQAEPRLHELKGDWLQLVYELISESLGGPVNGQAFTQLSRRVPMKTLRKFFDKPLVIEALLFGASGIMEDKGDSEYQQNLWLQFEHRKRQYSIRSMNKTHWKYMRLRPSGFPDVRLAQLAATIPLIPKLIDTPLADFEMAWQNVEIGAGEYWNIHYKLGVKAKKSRKVLTERMKATIFINALLPYHLLRSKLNADGHSQRQMSRQLQALKPEQNKITRYMQSFGFSNQNALESQSLIELFKQVCSKGKCLDCPLGQEIVKSNPI